MPITSVTAFLGSVQRYPQRAAVVCEDGQTVSYAQLNVLRLKASQALMAHGIAAGDRVAIWAANGLPWIIAGLAIHSVGAVLVPINTRMKGAEAGYILQKSAAKLLFCMGDFLGQNYPLMLKAHRPSSLENLVCFDACADVNTLSWEQFLAKAPQVTLEAVAERAGDVAGTDVMDILFTSGTTGQPKGVVTTHAQNLKVIMTWSAIMGLTSEDRYLVANPFFHAFGYKVGWLASLLAGCTIYPLAVFDTQAILRKIAEHRITVLPGPPTLFISLLQDPARAHTDLSSLRATITGAATIAPSLIERIRAELGFATVLTAYGLTETCGVVTLCHAQDDAETIALTSGRAMPQVEVICVNAQGQAQPAGATGEIWVRGYNVMQGYLDDPIATAEAITADGWLRTGDVGCLDSRGYLQITDRIKDLYISGGFNCYPAEIERIMAAHPAIAQVAVIGVPDARMGEVGKACVVLRANHALAASDLQHWCREHMANYKVPKVIEFFSSLPCNTSGKVLKFELRKSPTAA